MKQEGRTAIYRASAPPMSQIVLRWYEIQGRLTSCGILSVKMWLCLKSNKSRAWHCGKTQVKLLCRVNVAYQHCNMNRLHLCVLHLWVLCIAQAIPAGKNILHAYWMFIRLDIKIMHRNYLWPVQTIISNFIDATAIIGSVYIVGSLLIPLIAARSVSLLRFLASVQVFYPIWV